MADYPNTDGYALVYSFDGPSNVASVTATNVADGSFSVTLSAAITGVLDPGRYQWAAHAETGSGATIGRYPVASGIFIVRPRLLGDVVITHAARTLAVIEAALEGRLTGDMESYTIGNRQITKILIKELYSLRAMYRSEVARERNPRQFVVTRRVAFVEP